MNNISGSTRGKDEVGCIGRFDPQDTFCYRKCPLCLRCLIECNRRARLEQFLEILEFEDIGPVDLH